MPRILSLWGCALVAVGCTAEPQLDTSLCSTTAVVDPADPPPLDVALGQSRAVQLEALTVEGVTWAPSPSHATFALEGWSQGSEDGWRQTVATPACPDAQHDPSTRRQAHTTLTFADGSEIEGQVSFYLDEVPGRVFWRAAFRDPHAVLSAWSPDLEAALGGKHALSFPDLHLEGLWDEDEGTWWLAIKEGDAQFGQFRYPGALQVTAGSAP